MKIAVGAFSIECNSFAHGETTLDDFKKQIYVEKDSINRDSAGSSAEFAGAWDVLSAANVEIIPTLVATSSPRPPITSALLKEVCRQIVDAVPDDVDGVYLSLHGSAYCRDDEDPEGTLVEMLRKKIGTKPLIAISLDLHAYYTKKMLKNVDIATAYRTAPHIDLYETGARAAQILVSSLEQNLRPKTYRVEIPMITSAEQHDNTVAPFGPLIALCREAEKIPGVLTASLLPTQPWLDVEELGWKVIVTTSGEDVNGTPIAKRIADRVWKSRKEFMVTETLAPREALLQALSAPTLCAVSDMGDATNGGSPGDSTVLFREALTLDASGTFLLSIADKDGAEQAFATGIGNEITLSIGIGAPGSYNEATTFTGRVEKIAYRKIQYTHPATGGSFDDPGKAALIRVPGKTNPALEIFLVLHANPVRVIDPVIYELFDCDVQTFSAVQAKSPKGFKVGFARVTHDFRLANTPGPTTADLLTLEFHRRPVPLFPFERGFERG